MDELTTLRRIPVVPRRYEDTKPAVNQAFTHASILDIGKRIIEHYDEESDVRHKQDLKKCEEAVWNKAETYKDDCVSEAVKQSSIKEEKTVKQINQESVNTLEKEVTRVEGILHLRLLEKVEEERVLGERKLHETIAKLRESFDIEKAAAMQATLEEVGAVAFLDREDLQRKHEEAMKAQNRENEEKTLLKLEKLRTNMIKERSIAIKETVKHQQKIADTRIAEMEANFRYIIENLKQNLLDRKEKQRATEKELENMEALKNTYILKVKQTQSHMVEFMESCRPDFSEGQADYLMPLNFIDHDD